MSKVFKKLSALALVLVLAVGASGCREEDVVAGVIIGGVIGGVIGGGGGVQVGQPHPYPAGYTFLSDCEGYNRQWICDWRHGSWHRIQRRYHNWSAVETASASVDLKAVEIQKRWNLDSAASAKLSAAIENAKGGDLKAFDSIGLGLSDMNTLIGKNKIDINDLDRVASKLNTTSDKALALLNAFVGEYNSQKKDVTSAMWSQCQSTGHWKTPQSASCSALSEKGCSPEAGASACLPL
jgi:hypothetical protein